MASDINHMMSAKIRAVERIMDAAENTAITHQNEKYDEEFVNLNRYYNAKEMLKPGEAAPPNISVNSLELADRSIPRPYVRPSYIELNENEFFGSSVNISMSTVHVPTNVFDRSEIHNS